MADRYEIQFDLPFIKRGTVYFKDTTGEYNLGDRTSYIPDVVGMKHSRFAIHSDYVENNPAWFQKIEEKPPMIMVRHIHVGSLRSQEDRINDPRTNAYNSIDLPGEGDYVVLRESGLKEIASNSFHAGMKYLAFLQNPKGHEPDKEEYINNLFNNEA